jgi:excinuclease ABC subunit B
MVKAGYNILIPAERKRLIRHLESMMLEHAKNLEFEQAAMVRDEVAALKELGRKA